MEIDLSELSEKAGLELGGEPSSWLEPGPVSGQSGRHYSWGSGGWQVSAGREVCRGPAWVHGGRRGGRQEGVVVRAGGLAW